MESSPKEFSPKESSPKEFSSKGNPRPRNFRPRNPRPKGIFVQGNFAQSDFLSREWKFMILIRKKLNIVQWHDIILSSEQPNFDFLIFLGNFCSTQNSLRPKIPRPKIPFDREFRSTQNSSTQNSSTEYSRPRIPSTEYSVSQKIVSFYFIWLHLSSKIIVLY